MKKKCNDHTIESFKNWNKVVDYESDEDSVDLLDKKGKSLGSYGYKEFTREDFFRFKNAQGETMKTFYIQNNIGKAKYVVNYNDGVTKNRDGSPFTGIRIFSNKKKMAIHLTKLKKEGYVEKN